MILVKQTKDGWEYQLTQAEANCLGGLLNQFPITADVSVKISRTSGDPQTADRQKLLDESLADHRQILRKKAQSLMSARPLKVLGKECRFCLTSADREMLLQILNDIRVGSWRALGEPQNLKPQGLNPSDREHVFNNIMNLAGYFEHHLLNHPPSATA